ncbi:MAG TPA: LysM domain-containing protein [Solirubrobacteraceae bacterium]
MVGKLARFLAPIALAAVAVGVYLIVHATVVPRTAAGTNTSSVIVTTHRQPAHKKARPRPRFYVVKSGDTLSAISGKTGVSVVQLGALNPSIANAPNNLQTGQRLTLRRRR